jgi:hypothetical protein
MDRARARRLMRPHVSEADKLIDDARPALAGAARRVIGESGRSSRRVESDGKQGRCCRPCRVSGGGTVWRSCARASGCADTIRERDAELRKLRRAVAVMQEGNVRLGLRLRSRRSGKVASGRPTSPPEASSAETYKVKFVAVQPH